MNRLMQIECVQGDCKCGENCQNQRYVCTSVTSGLTTHVSLHHSRFQRKEYAPIDIVKTEKKGFGVRTREDLAA